jgi:hypothetical protein
MLRYWGRRRKASGGNPRAFLQEILCFVLVFNYRAVKEERKNKLLATTHETLATSFNIYTHIISLLNNLGQHG